MKTITYSVHDILPCRLTKQDGEAIVYYRLLIMIDRGKDCYYDLVKTSKEFAESFKDFDTPGLLLFDIRGRVIGFQLLDN